MKLRVMVLEEVFRTFQKKNGTEGSESGLSVRDVANDGPRCTNNLTYLWGKGEADKYKGKLRDRFIEIGVTSLSAGFGGVVKAEGAILGVEGPDPAANGKTK